MGYGFTNRCGCTEGKIAMNLEDENMTCPPDQQTEHIRARQRAEGFDPCFRTGRVGCDQVNQCAFVGLCQSPFYPRAGKIRINETPNQTK